IKTAPQTRLRTTPAERLPSVAYSSLDPVWQERLGEREPDLLVPLSGDVRDARATLERQGPTYHADLDVQATAGEVGVWETFTVRVEPEGGRTVDRFIACVAPNDREPLAWSLVEGPPGATLSVERLEKPPEDVAGPPGAWFELTLRPGAASPFVIRAERGRAVDAAEMRLGMLLLPEAVSQTGRLVVRTVGRSSIELDNQGLTPIPIPDREDDPAGWRRAAYRFESSLRNDAGFGHVLLRRRGGPSEPSALVWLCDVRSRGEADGVSQHWIEYWLQNGGQPQIELTLPSASRVSGVWVDDRRLPQHRESDRLTVDLPLDRRRLCVRVAIETADDSGWGPVQPVGPPLVRIDLPVLQTRWSLWTPHDRRLVDAGPWRSALDVGRPTWSQRLFGPLGRSTHDEPFPISDPAAWKALFQGEPARDAEAARVRAFLSRLKEVVEERIAQNTQWNELLAEAAGSGAANTVDLWIDWQALAGVGVSPFGFVREAKAPIYSVGPEGSELLAGHGLVLVLHRKSVLLTTLAAVAGENSPAQPYAGRTDLRVVRNESLGDALWKTAVRADCPPHLPVAAWGLAPGRADFGVSAALPNPASLGLSSAPDDGDFAALMTPDGHGWNVYRLDALGSADAAVTLVDEPTLAGWRWSAFLFAAALGACWPRRWLG
ncbi:MAG TPA: hypothetical protein VGE52_09950, partial [Pirellulales bacterium]